MRIGREKEAARERERNKERRKRGNRKFGQSKYKHAKKGVLSCMIAVPASLIFIILIVTSIVKHGQLAPIAGSFGLFTVLIAVIGFIIGGRGFREREKNYLTCKIGMGINGFLIIFLTAIFIRGII